MWFAAISRQSVHFAADDSNKERQCACSLLGSHLYALVVLILTLTSTVGEKPRSGLVLFPLARQRSCVEYQSLSQNLYQAWMSC